MSLRSKKISGNFLKTKTLMLVFIATHLNTGMHPWQFLALKAGKHVYIEKPCSHNPHENDLLVTAQKKIWA